MARLVGTFTPDPGSINNSHFSTAAADVLDVTKVTSLVRRGTNFTLALTGTPTTRSEVLYVALAAGTIRGFHAMLNVDGSSTSITYDLKKNGTTVLSSVITLTDSTGDRTTVDATLSVTTYAAGDVFSVVQTVSSSTGAQGPWCYADFAEVPA